jgi:hypothetical protein
LSWLPISLTHARSPMRSLSAVDSSMSVNRIATLPLGASRARSGRSTSAQSARSSIEDRTAAPSPSAQDVGGLPDLFDSLPTTREQHVSGFHPAVQRGEFALLTGVAPPDDDECHRLHRRDPREHISRNLRSHHRSSIGC